MTPEQREAALKTMQIWQQDAEEARQVEKQPERTFEDDLRSFQAGRLEEIEPGLREDRVYMAQLALGIPPQGNV